MPNGSKFAEPEPWTRLSAVLAEAAGESESRAFDMEAEAQAGRLRGVRRDWANKPTITWTMAAELLASLRAERARVAAEHEERVIAAAAAQLASIPRGISMDGVPEGLSAAQMMMLSDPFPSKRRQSVLEHSLEHPNGALVYNPIGGEE